jgi:hypothetical protein
MSLETKIENLTAAIRDLIGVMNNQKQETLNVAPAAPVAPAPAPVVQAAPVVTAPLVQAAPVAAPVMPAPPTFVAPAANLLPTATATTTTSNAPFSDANGMMQYVMGAYKALGPQKGAMIQGVLTGLGYQNINDVKPEHYGQLFAGVEALK